MNDDAYIWPRGDYFLEHFIPLDFTPVKTPRAVKPTIDAAHTFLDVCTIYKYGETLSKDEWISAIEYVGVEGNLANIIFQNCANDTGNAAPKRKLVLDILLLSMEHYSYNGNRTLFMHGDVVCELIRELFADILVLLLRCTEQYQSMTYEAFSKISLEICAVENLEFLDLIFEGSINGNLVDEVLPLSHIGNALLSKDSFRISNIIDILRKWLISNPFCLNDISIFKKSSCFSAARKQTSLGITSRRRVVVAHWKRLEILRKGVYNNVHLRITNNQPNASFLFSPWNSQSVCIEYVHDCPGVIIGPTKGVVIVHECSNTYISCLARSIVIWKCRNLVIFSASKQSVILRQCENIRLAPYNVAYTGLRKEMFYANLDLDVLNKDSSKKAIVLDDSTYHSLRPSKFYIQPVPFDRNQDELEALLESLPDHYKNSWTLFSSTIDRSKAKDFKLSKKDASYLRSKIDVNNNT